MIHNPRETNRSRAAASYEESSALPTLPGHWPAIVVFGMLALTSVVLLVARTRFPVDSLDTNWLQIVLVAASWLLAAFLFRESFARRSLPISAVLGCGALATLSLVVWSTSAPLAVAILAPPVAILLTGCVVACKDRERALGNRSVGESVAREADAPESAAPPDPVIATSPVLSETDAPPRSAGVPADSANEFDSPESGGEQLWEQVQQEFTGDPALAQNITRWETASGQQTLVVNIRCQVPAGGTARMHIPWWPFLSGQPEVFCRVVDGPAANIRVLRAKPDGMVIELTLAEPQPESISLVIEAVAMSDCVEKSSPAA